MSVKRNQKNHFYTVGEAIEFAELAIDDLSDVSTKEVILLEPDSDHPGFSTVQSGRINPQEQFDELSKTYNRLWSILTECKCERVSLMDWIAGQRDKPVTCRYECGSEFISEYPKTKRKEYYPSWTVLFLTIVDDYLCNMSYGKFNDDRNQADSLHKAAILAEMELSRLRITIRQHLGDQSSVRKFSAAGSVAEREEYFLKCYEAGMTASSIRDKWNSENLGKQIGDKMKGISNVNSGIRRARKRREIQ